jgi:hypothetical protein
VIPLVFGVAGAAIACKAESMNVLIIGTAFLGIGGSPLGIVTAIPSVSILSYLDRGGTPSLIWFASSFAGSLAT